MLRGSARAGCLTEMALLSPHQLRGRSSVPHWAEAGAQTEALEDLPQMTQVLKEVGLESGLMSDPEPALLTPLHPHSSMRKDLDFPTGPRGQNDAWHVWNTGKGKSPSVCWDALISRAFFDWEQLPGGWGGVWLASQRHGCTGEGWLQHSCLENPHGQKSLVGYSPRGCKESDATEQPITAHSTWIQRK